MDNEHQEQLFPQNTGLQELLLTLQVIAVELRLLRLRRYNNE